MVKKTTWQDAKKKWKKGLEDLKKLEKQEQALKAKIQIQNQANNEAYADYIVKLSSVSQKTQQELEAFYLGNTNPHVGGD